MYIIELNSVSIQIHQILKTQEFCASVLSMMVALKNENTLAIWLLMLEEKKLKIINTCKLNLNKFLSKIINQRSCLGIHAANFTEDNFQLVLIKINKKH